MKRIFGVGLSAMLLMAFGCSSKQEVTETPAAAPQPETATASTTTERTTVESPVVRREAASPVVPTHVAVNHHHRRHHHGRRHHGKKVAVTRHTGTREIALYDVQSGRKVLIRGANRDGRAVVFNGEHVTVIDMNAERGTSSGLAKNCPSPATGTSSGVRQGETVTMSFVARKNESKADYLSRVHDELGALDLVGKDLRHTGDATRIDAFDQRFSEARSNLRRLYWSTGTNWQKYTPRMDADLKAIWSTTRQGYAR